MNIYLDFDGTVVEHDYPEIGKLNPGALEVIKKLQDAGHTIILNTMRVEFNDGTLEEASVASSTLPRISQVYDARESDEVSGERSAIFWTCSIAEVYSPS